MLPALLAGHSHVEDYVVKEVAFGSEGEVLSGARGSNQAHGAVGRPPDLIQAGCGILITERLTCPGRVM